MSQTLCTRCHTVSDDRRCVHLGVGTRLMVWAVKYFRPYFCGWRFIIRADHKLTGGLQNFKDPQRTMVQVSHALLLLRPFSPHVNNTIVNLSSQQIFLCHVWFKRLELYMRNGHVFPQGSGPKNFYWWRTSRRHFAW